MQCKMARWDWLPYDSVFRTLTAPHLPRALPNRHGKHAAIRHRDANRERDP